MEQEILEKLQQQEEKLEAVYQSMERLRKIFLWILVITVATVVLPIIAALIILPMVLNTLSSTYQGLGL